MYSFVLLMLLTALNGFHTEDASLFTNNSDFSFYDQADRNFLNKLYKFLSFTRYSSLSEKYISNFHTYFLPEYSFYELTFMAKLIYDTQFEDVLITRIDRIRLAKYFVFSEEIENLDKKTTCYKNMFYRMNNSIYSKNLLDHSLYPNLKPISAWDLQCLQISLQNDKESNREDIFYKQQFHDYIINPFSVMPVDSNPFNTEINIWKKANEKLLTRIKIELRPWKVKYLKKQYISEFHHYTKLNEYTFYELTYMAKLIYDTEYENRLLVQIDELRLAKYMSKSDIIKLEKQTSCATNMFYRMNNILYTNRLHDFSINPQLKQISFWDWSCLDESIENDSQKNIYNLYKIDFRNAFPKMIERQKLFSNQPKLKKSFWNNIFRMSSYKVYIGLIVAMLIAFTIFISVGINWIEPDDDDTIQPNVTFSTSFTILTNETVVYTNYLPIIIAGAVFGSIIFLLISLYRFFEFESKSLKKSKKEASKCPFPSKSKKEASKCFLASKSKKQASKCHRPSKSSTSKKNEKKLIAKT